MTDKPAAANDGRSLRILVVEDDKDACVIFHKLFKKQGWETTFAVDGMSAISQARKFNPDLIILDIGLPAGDGFTVLQRLKANIHFAIIPIIIVSSRSPDTHEERALSLGARAFLQKPVDAAKLLEAVNDAMGDEPSI